MRVLTDHAECGPVTLALPQDVQAEAYDYPEAFFAPRCWRIRRPPPDPAQLADAAAALSRARAPLIIAGGGVQDRCSCAPLRVAGRVSRRVGLALDQRAQQLDKDARGRE
jgi:3D-(3,5/4)-trihydroxycyclohexane-1,2-dione acylhydrolase (decyclizing)